MPSKLPHYALRIPTQTMDKLKYIAERNGRSANKEIEQLILQHIADFEKKNGTIQFDDGFEPRSRS
ncbi:Arc family DNA-binding protein [Clostridium sp. D33t1_170424_F3]|uniref:Arc family DNA-binding protein n=1 Tax=Clostridium sp. D33t1_170424_F3 TaxID=2787099 RepID=UPI0018AAD01D|nr:Arc family DNA-binding protein [Clostridium sp. D33t1_170424_F3]